MSRFLQYFRLLYVQVLAAILLGAVLGVCVPQLAQQLKPLSDGFVKLIRMLVAPIVFTTVVMGVAGAGDLKKVGRTGLKALIYFEAVTTIALLIGALVMHLFEPGRGASPARLDPAALNHFTSAGPPANIPDFVLHIIPGTFVGAFAEGEVLQVLLLALLFGWALSRLGDRGKKLLGLVQDFSAVIFGMVALVTRLAPIGAFGAIAFTVASEGPGVLLSLGRFMLLFLFTGTVFVFGVLGTIARLNGFSLWRILRLIREELMIALSTSSSEPTLPGLTEKLERVGCSRMTVGIVLPAGYSFNLDGTCLYLGMAALFMAQATGTSLSLLQELGLLAMLMLTSKGVAGVASTALFTLASTLSATGTIPLAGLALLIGIDRFMSDARTVINVIGNAVVTLVIAKSEKELDAAQAGSILHKPQALSVASSAEQS